MSGRRSSIIAGMDMAQLTQTGEGGEELDPNSQAFLMRVREAVEELREELDEERRRVEELEEQKEEYERELTRAAEALDSDQAQLAEKDDTIAKLEERTRELEHEMDELQRAAEEELDGLADVREELQKCRDDIAAKEEAIAAKDSAITDLENRLSELSTESTHLQQRLQEKDTQVNEQEAAATTRLESFKDTLARDHQLALEEKDTQIGAIEQELLDEREARTQLEEALQTTATRLETTHTELTEVRGSLEEAQAELERLRTADTQLTAVKEELGGVRAQYEEAAEFRAKCEVYQQNIQTLRTERSQAHERLVTLTRENADLRYTLKQLQESDEARRQLELDRERLTASLQDAVNGRIRLERELLESSNRLAEMKTAATRAVQLEDDKQRLMREKLDLDHHRRDLEGTCYKLQKLARSKDATIAELKKETADLVRIREELKRVEVAEREREENYAKLVDGRVAERFEKLRAKYEGKIARLQRQLMDRDGYEQRMRELVEAELSSLQRWNKEMEEWDVAARRARQHDDNTSAIRAENNQTLLNAQMKQIARGLERRLHRALHRSGAGAGAGGGGATLRDRSYDAYVNPYTTQYPPTR